MSRMGRYVLELQIKKQEECYDEPPTVDVSDERYSVENQKTDQVPIYRRPVVGINPTIEDELKNLGIDLSGNIQSQLSKIIINTNETITELIRENQIRKEGIEHRSERIDYLVSKIEKLLEELRSVRRRVELDGDINENNEGHIKEHLHNKNKLIDLLAKQRALEESALLKENKRIDTLYMSKD